MVTGMIVGHTPLDEKRPPETAPADGEGTPKPPWRKIVVLATVVGVLLAMVYLSPLRAYLERWREIGAYVHGLGWWAPLALTLGVALLVTAGFPRLVLCMIAGLALGFWSGLLWAQVGTLLGNYALFLAARLGRKGWAQRYLSSHSKLNNLVRQEGISGVILARQLPVPGLLINLACGFFSIRTRDFLLGTVIGQLPEAIPCTLIGAGALKDSFSQSVKMIGWAIAAAVVAWIGLRYFLRWQRSKATVIPSASVRSAEPAEF
ncbi:MAG TPA: VTT domain-containing protein [Candidatus Sulfotelmatobacter sp.]|nr:VTT domain-containing protein [Candidatus Sulfotelmatobacter sp.]